MAYQYGKATCPTCYRRFRAVFPDDDQRGEWRIDTPAVRCDHRDKKPISEALTKRLPYHDALCLTCGRVLRHPEGRGSWQEVLFYGFLIHEEP